MSLVRSRFGTGTPVMTHDVILEPDNIKEAVAYMPSPGTIDFTDLRFKAVANHHPTTQEQETKDATIDVVVSRCRPRHARRDSAT